MWTHKLNIQEEIEYPFCSLFQKKNQIKFHSVHILYINLNQLQHTFPKLCILQQCFYCDTQLHYAFRGPVGNFAENLLLHQTFPFISDHYLHAAMKMYINL